MSPEGPISSIRGVACETTVKLLRSNSLHDSVVIHSTSGSDIHDEVVFFYSVYRFFSGDWRHNTSDYS